jgi:hypothetical protein
LWDVIAKEGDVTKAYPEELLSLDLYTKGKIKAGDQINAGLRPTDPSRNPRCPA